MRTWNKAFRIGPYLWNFQAGWSWDGWTITNAHGDEFRFLFKASTASRAGYPKVWGLTLWWCDVMFSCERLTS